MAKWLEFLAMYMHFWHAFGVDPGNGNGAKMVVDLLQELVATNKRMEERQISFEKLLMELVAVNVRVEERQARMEERQARMERRQDVMEGHLSALAEIVRSGFDRVGRELEKVNARIDETNASLRLLKGAASGALEHDDSRIRALERRVDAIEEKVEKKSA